MNNFIKWAYQFKNPVLCSWSKSELDIFSERLSRITFNNDRVIKMFDLQKSYMNLMNLKNTPSLKSVLENNDILINENYKLHSALNDALYTSALLIKFFEYFSFNIQEKTEDTYSRLSNKNTTTKNKTLTEDLLINEIYNYIIENEIPNYTLFVDKMFYKYSIERETINGRMNRLIDKNIIETYEYMNKNRKLKHGIRVKNNGSHI
jgi:DNA polymerase III epsilon subunit-like protein